MVIDITGIHTVRITYCFCEDNGVGNRRTQLLDARWFPASWSRPGTAFTFRLLDHIHKLQARSKVNLYDFYTNLETLTNSAGLKPPLVRPRFFTFPSRAPNLMFNVYSIVITS